jgi:predicted dehydrogenase
MNVGVIGAGYWGPNIIRNFMRHPKSRVTMVCDVDPERLEKIRQMYPHIECTTNYHDLLKNPGIDLIAICTPVSSHFSLAKNTLLAQKHVLIEKPMTETGEQAEELISIARQRNLYIFVDHTFLFTPAVQKMKTLIQKKELGELYYFDSVRINLGLFQHDVSVVWDLAVHDFSILLYLINENPVTVSATGAAHFNPNLHDMAYISLQYSDNFIAHIHVNWLSPVKVRKCLIAGSGKMLVWDDTLADEKLKIYDRGIDVVENTNQIYELLVQYRSGDMVSPQLPNEEALYNEVAHIVNVIHQEEDPLSDGELGFKVVRLLEAANQSIQQGGRPIKVLM